MSVVVSGPRRVYVILLIWQRLTESCCACPRSLSRAGEAVASEPSPTCNPLCRLVMRVGLQRVLWQRLIGLRVLILDPGGQQEPARPSPTSCASTSRLPGEPGGCCAGQDRQAQ